MRVFSLVLLLATVQVPPAAAQMPWQTVTSAEGQFSVEMPTQPTFTKTKTRNGPDGQVKVLTLGCETASGLYLVYKEDLPTAIVKGTEDVQLDAERDELAREWSGKVLGEKKVRAAGRLGRDYTIRGKPLTGTGILTVRVRTYLVEKTIYSVIVVSAENRELPEGTGRFLGSLALGTVRTRVAGTPEPEPTGKELPGGGLAIDPDNDCQFRPGNASLALQVPGTLHDLNPDTGKLNAPRVLTTVNGDFIVRVKVSGDFQPGGKSTNPRGVPYNGAGILVWSDSDNFIRLERSAMLRGGQVRTSVAFEEREGGYRGAVHNEASRPGTAWLSMGRKGSRIFGAISFDGTSWHPLKPIDTVWPAKLKVGLVAVNSSSQPLNVQFEDFTLNTVAQGGRK
jgi:regulation of enolase protein 1 (concanavalin A-like superfamily)